MEIDRASTVIICAAPCACQTVFFAVFFGTLWYTRNLSVPWLGEGATKELLWPAFDATWPTNGPGKVGGDIELVVGKADYEINLVQRLNENFFSTLRAKLNWGSDIRN